MAKLVAGTSPKFELSCTSQGLPAKTMNQRQLAAWLMNELKLWEESDFRGSVTVVSQGSYNVELIPTYGNMLSNILGALERGDFGPLQLYLAAAKTMSVLILQSELGTTVRTLDSDSRRYIATALSTGILTTPNSGFADHFQQVRAIIAVNPFFRTGINLAEATNITDSLVEQLKKSTEVLDKLKSRSAGFENQMSQQFAALNTQAEEERASFIEWFTLQREELEATRDIYHKQVQTEAAAIYWETKSRNSSRIAWGALAAFVVLVVGAMGVGFLNFGPIKAYVQDLASSGSTISLTPIVVVTVPVLAYAWILRHISRVFIQNLTIADDAAYRRLMTMTFLGLSHDPKSGVTQAERAIILNALFRPAPPNTTEDGPPTGLLDIITKKA